MHVMSESGILIGMNYFCVVLYIMYVCMSDDAFKYQLLYVFSHNAHRVSLMYCVVTVSLLLLINIIYVYLPHTISYQTNTHS